MSSFGGKFIEQRYSFLILERFYSFKKMLKFYKKFSHCLEVTPVKMANFLAKLLKSMVELCQTGPPNSPKHLENFRLNTFFQKKNI